MSETEPKDLMIECIEEDCRREFVFDVGEQKFFKEKDFHPPKRCPSCRRKRRELKQKEQNG